MNKNDVKDALKLSTTKIVFTKKDGTERTMICTINGGFIPESDYPKGTGTTKVNENVQSVYDVENSGWRSFRWDSVISVNDTVFTSN